MRVRKRFDLVNETVERFVQVHDGQWDRTICCDVRWQEEPVKTTPLGLLTHAVTHEFHHKGQIVAMARHLGHVPPTPIWCFHSIGEHRGARGRSRAHRFVSMRLLPSKFFDFLLGKARHLGDVFNLHDFAKQISDDLHVPLHASFHTPLLIHLLPTSTRFSPPCPVDSDVSVHCNRVIFPFQSTESGVRVSDWTRQWR